MPILVASFPRESLKRAAVLGWEEAAVALGLDLGGNAARAIVARNVPGHLGVHEVEEHFEALRRLAGARP